MQQMKHAIGELQKPEVREFFEKESKREQKADKVETSARKRNQRAALSSRLRKVREIDTQAQQILAAKIAAGIM